MIKVDKEFKSLIPPLAKEEREQLEANIIADGCRDPLVVWQGILIDGHNRYEICTRNGIKFKTESMEFDSRNDAKIWIIQNQFGRRNLQPFTRTNLVLLLEPLIAAKAALSYKENVGRPSKSSQKSDTIVDKIDTKKELAKAADVSHDTVAKVKLINKAKEAGEVAPEVIEKLNSGDVSINRVARDIKENQKAKKRETQRKEAAEKTEPQLFDNVHIGDFREHADKVQDGSLSLIFTDPPYDRKSIELFDGLGKFANDKLAEGGSLICYVGQTQIPQAIKQLDVHLRYWWTLCCLHSGGANLMNEYGIRCGWKAVLWFVKSTRDDKETIVSDVMSGGREKSHHDWQQSQSESEYWIENLCPKDGIVCDPFLGGGTTAAAAIAKGRKWVGFEIDHDQAVLAMSRCKK